MQCECKKQRLRAWHALKRNSYRPTRVLDFDFDQSQTRIQIRLKCQSISGAYSDDESSYEQTLWNLPYPSDFYDTLLVPDTFHFNCTPYINFFIPGRDWIFRNFTDPGLFSNVISLAIYFKNTIKGQRQWRSWRSYHLFWEKKLRGKKSCPDIWLRAQTSFFTSEKFRHPTPLILHVL